MEESRFYWLELFGAVVPAYFLSIWWHGWPWERPRYSRDLLGFVVISLLYQMMQTVPILEGDGPFVPGLSSALALLGALVTLAVMHPDYDKEKPGWFITFMTCSIIGHGIWVGVLRR